MLRGVWRAWRALHVSETVCRAAQEAQLLLLAQSFHHSAQRRGMRYYVQRWKAVCFGASSSADHNPSASQQLALLASTRRAQEQRMALAAMHQRTAQLASALRRWRTVATHFHAHSRHDQLQTQLHSAQRSFRSRSLRTAFARWTHRLALHTAERALHKAQQTTAVQYHRLQATRRWWCAWKAGVQDVQAMQQTAQVSAADESNRWLFQTKC